MKSKVDRMGPACAGEDTFTVNPFRTLDTRLFPAHRPGRKLLGNPENDPENDSESTDRQLFLSAVTSPSMGKKRQQPGGFQIGEQCVLPQIKKTLKKQATWQEPEPAAIEDREKDEFLLAMRNTQPLPGKGRQIAKTAVMEPGMPSEEPDFADMLTGTLKFTMLWSDEYLEGRVSNLDDLLMNRLREGQLGPEAHIDLHGLNVMQAFEELKYFVRDSWYKGLRVVLVVTGRGLNSPAGHGILRRKVQSWLTQEPFKRVVLAFCTALPQDGGPGSIYVLLRRYRKKGRICWEKMPADADLY